MFLQRKNSIYEMTWNGELPYGKVRHQDEVELSRYAFDVADVEMLRRHFEDWERESGRCLECAEPLVVPALEAALKMSHLFNLLDARGAVAVTERVALIGRVRKLAVRCAKEYVAQRERLGFPLGRNGKKNGNSGGNGRVEARGAGGCGEPRPSAPNRAADRGADPRAAPDERLRVSPRGALRGDPRQRPARGPHPARRGLRAGS